MKKSKIGWTDHTKNFWHGCRKVSPACAHCYAETVAKVYSKRLFGHTVLWGKGQKRGPRLAAARKEALKLNRKAEKEQQAWANGRDIFEDRPRRPRVFVNSMSDWLDEEIPIAWLAFLLETLFLCPYLDFQLLTKRPENCGPRLEAVLQHIEASPEWDKLPGSHPTVAFRNWLADWYVLAKPRANLWIGITAENQEWFDKRYHDLVKIPARVRFLSCEPLLSAISFRPKATIEETVMHAQLGKLDNLTELSMLNGLHWVIAGGESGSKARPSHPDWYRSLRDQCAAADVPFFFKQHGEWVFPDQETIMRLPKRRFKDGRPTPDGPMMLKVGTKLSGRLLDGVEHSAFPTAA